MRSSLIPKTFFKFSVNRSGMLIIIFLTFLGSVPAQEVPRSRAVSAYIYNFAKSLKWKNEQHFSEFRFHIITSDQNTIQEMNLLAKNRELRGKQIKVTIGNSSEITVPPHLIYLAPEFGSLLPVLFDKIERQNVLLVSDGYSDKRLIMLNLFSPTENTLKFELNRANLINQQFEISPELILMGGTEIDVAGLYKEGQQNLRKLQRRIDSLETVMHSLQDTIAFQSRLEKAQREYLKKLTITSRDQQKILDSVNTDLKKHEQEIVNVKQQLSEQQSLLKQRNQELAAQKAELIKGYKELEYQKEKIRKQDSLIAAKTKILKEREAKIKKQQQTQYLLIIVLSLALLLAALLYVWYRNKKHLTALLEKKVFERTSELIDSNEKLNYELNERKKAERLLQESEAHYRYLFQDNPVPMLIYETASLKILAVNNAFTRAFGYTAEETETLTLLDLYPENEKENVALLISGYKGKQYGGEWHHLKKDGTLISVETYSDGYNYKGQDARIVVLTDITERKAAESAVKENMTKFRTLFETNPEAIFITDAETLEIFDCNETACRMNGYTREELLGKSINILHPPDVAQTVEPIERRKEFVKLLEEKKSVTVESVHIRKDGTSFPIQTTMAALKLNNRDYVIGIDRDITEIKKAEEIKRRYQLGLEEVVRKRTAELEVALERAESADRLKSAFLATMSHELRTPLNSIIGFTGIILKGFAGPLTDEQKKQLGMVKGSAQHLLELINDVLDISKIEAGQLVVVNEVFHFGKMLEKAVATVMPLAEKKNLKIELVVDENIGEITSDERRLSQVFINLINNAVKFTEQGFVKVNAALKDGMIVTKVIDTGIGIAPEDMDKLFKPFSQVDTGLTRNHEGTGLGLSISQKLIEKLGGKIKVESEVGLGSTFTVLIKK